MFRSILVAAVLTLTAPPAAAQQYCQSVQFQRGAYAHAVQGYANAARAQCYVLDVRPGQAARVRIVNGAVFFSTTHTTGTYQDVQFITQSGRLYVYVHTDFGGQQPFVIEFAFI